MLSTRLSCVCRQKLRIPGVPSLQVIICNNYSTTRAVLLSTQDSESKASQDDGEDTHTSGVNKKQPFVQASIDPGEWDPFHYENPLFRPKFEGRSKILRQEDFERRPRVGFSERFENMTDAMINLTWMTHQDQLDIFELYKSFLHKGKKFYNVTSHEYVVRCIANKFNITAERVAAVVQLQWNQAKYELDGTVELDYERGRYMDYSIMSEIRDCYKAYKMTPPKNLSFVEEVLGIPPPSKTWHEVDDVFDYDELWRKYLQEHLPQKSRKMLNEHIYLEDKYDYEIPTPVDKETMDFMEQQKRFTQLAKEAESSNTPQELKSKDEDRPERRPRWPFVAQMVNSRKLKKKRKEALQNPILGFRKPLKRELLSTRYRNQSNENTLVEQDGDIRPATQADINGVAWKPQRLKRFKTYSMSEHLSVQEFAYRTAKQDWLDYFHGRPHSGVFGEQPNDYLEQLEKQKVRRGRRPQWDRKWGPRGGKSMPEEGEEKDMEEGEEEKDTKEG